jgi:hypothetical protein
LEVFKKVCIEPDFSIDVQLLSRASERSLVSFIVFLVFIIIPSKVAVFEGKLFVNGLNCNEQFCNFMLQDGGDLLSLDEPVYTVVNKPSKSGKTIRRGCI